MKKLALIPITALLIWAGACESSCHTEPHGPMSSNVTLLQWVRTETPSGIKTPATEGYHQRIYRLNLHMYVVRDTTVSDRLRIVREDKDDDIRTFFCHYKNGERQRYEYVYQFPKYRGGIVEVIVSDRFKGAYTKAQDTVRTIYRPIPPDDLYEKYAKEEDLSPLR